MFRRSIKLLAIVSVLCSFMTAGLASRVPPRGPMKRALLIAIKGYKAPFPELEYPLNDVARIEELLASPRYGFAGNIEKLTDNSDKDHQPTRDNILAAMRRVLVTDAVAGDTMVIYYSGHGSSIKNTLNKENDLRDETIVPIDAARPNLPADAFAKLQPEERSDLFAKTFHDIRDKELRELFHEAKKKGVMLTVILDSCHSGSATKGDEVSKEVDGVDVDLMLPPTAAQLAAKPEEDALVLAAAKDYQVATGGTHELRGQTALYSHFTAGLVEALYKTPADIVSADELFQEIVAGMQSDSRTMQTPMMIGTSLRTERNIFGDVPKRGDARLRTPGMSKDGASFLTRAGIADGVSTGDEFKCVSPENTPVTVTVKTVDIGSSEVQVIGSGNFAACGLFAQTRYSRAKRVDLSVWIPPALTDEQVRAAADALKGVALADPAAIPAPKIAFPEVVAGVLKWRKGATRAAALPVSGDVAAAGESVFVDIGPTTELRSQLVKELAADPRYRVNVTADRSLADYELIGQPSGGSVKYSWMLRAEPLVNLAKKPAKSDLLPPPSMPRSTYALGAEDPGAASDLATLARRISKIRNLMKLASEGAAAYSKFPYRLEVLETETQRVLKAGDVIDTAHAYDFRLARVRTDVDLMTEFTIYLIDIDPHGESTNFFAKTFGSHVGDKDCKIDPLDPPQYINLVRLALSDKSPAGTDSILFLVTGPDKKVDATQLESPPIMDLQRAKGDSTDPFGEITGERSGAKGGPGSDDWAMQSTLFRTSVVPQPAALNKLYIDPCGAFPDK